jgi:lysophospholipase L1-like esterase
MAYTVHNFEQGDVLYAEQLNEMDAQIAANEESIENSVSSDMLAESYSANKTYSIGDYVIYNNELYTCIYEITAPEGWNSAHWRIANLGDGISDLGRQISDVEENQIPELKSDLTSCEELHMTFIEDGIPTDNDYYKGVSEPFTNTKLYAFVITTNETCTVKVTTNYTQSASNMVDDLGNVNLVANEPKIIFAFRPTAPAWYFRVAKQVGGSAVSISYTLKVYEIKEKANKSDLDSVEAELSTDIDNLENAVMEPLNVIGRAAKTYSGSDFTSHDLYFSDGTAHEYASPWCSTDFINCLGYTELSYVAEAFYSAQYNIDVAFVSFFDENKDMIDSLNSSDYSNGAVSGDATIPSGAVYVRVVGQDTKTRSLILKSNGYIKKIDQLWNDVETGLKICCIGDSLTEGVDGETPYPPHVIAENYPYFMGKYLNATTLNYGKAGTSPNTWWANLSSYGFTFDSSIDVVLIMFGTNGNLNTNTLATDVEPYNDWHDYANTGVGCYCKIIEYLMEQTQNHAQIILCTAPFNHYDENDYYQRAKKSVDTTKAIAERYLLPVIDVYYKSGLNDFNGDVFRPHDNMHFSAKGYHRLGTFIGSQTKAYLSRFSLDDEYNDELPIT